MCGLNAEGESSFPSPTDLPPNHFASFGMQAKERNWLVKSGSQEMIWRSGWTPNRRFFGTVINQRRVQQLQISFYIRADLY